MKLSLVNKEHETGDIWSFFFEPLEPINWIAGQSIRLELPKPTYGIDERRFSIASSPTEKHIRITTRKSESLFKQMLFQLKLGEIINAYSVEGTFIWGDEKQHRLLLAGGIGITPFRSMLLEQVRLDKAINAELIYGFSSGSIFDQEFKELMNKDSTFHYTTLKGKRIDPEDTSLFPNNWKQRKIYISGPRKMVEELAAALRKEGISDRQLKLDLFTGYIDG